MKKMYLYIATILVLFSCKKEEIQTVQPSEEFPCGVDYSHFKNSLPEDVQYRRMYPQYFSKEDLIKVYLKYLNEGNKEGLKNLLITGDEFKNWIYPEYNIANPNCGIPSQMIYKSVANKSIEGMDRMEQEMYYKDYELLKLEFTNQNVVNEYESYRLHNRTLIHVKNGKGEFETIAIVGSVVQLNGQYKFLSYRENNFAPSK